MIIEELAELKSTQQLVIIELADYGSTLIQGYIIKANYEIVLVQLVDDNGRSNGYTVFEPELIEHFYWGNRDLQCIHQLFKEKSTIVPVELEADNLMSAILELSLKYEAIALHEISDGDKYDIARIITNDEDWIKFESLGTTTHLSSITIVKKISKICRIGFDFEYLNDIIKLYSYKTFNEDL